MDNLHLLFEKNKGTCKKIKLFNGREAHCIINSDENGLWTGNGIRKMIAFSNQLKEQYRSAKIPVVFIFKGNTFIDKLTFVFVECICYYLAQQGYFVQVYMTVKREIGIEGIESSPLLLLNNTGKKTAKEYLNKFCKDFYRNHYRRIIKAKDIKTNVIGELYTELDSFLKVFAVGENFRDKVSNTVAELVGNAIEHAGADCLIDVDVTTSYGKEGDTEDNHYYGVNIAVINFSDKLIGDDLKIKVYNKSNEFGIGRYSKVLEAFQNHKSEFNEDYLEEDFFNVSAFQHKISGRIDLTDGVVGGTGLTKLIKALQESSEAYRCYVISGNRAVNFYHNYLEYDSEGWIGFNDDNDYIKSIPCEKIAGECLIYMPGTAFNLNFVFKGGDKYGK